MRVERAMQEAAVQAIARAAEATGVDFGALLATAKRESGLNQNAKATTSSATGLFQFVEGTWLEMVRRHGAKHGLGAQAAALAQEPNGETRRAVLALRSDPDLSARLAGELTRDNAAVLERTLGRTPTNSELYAAHVLGPGGAARLIRAGEAPAAPLLPQAAAANRSIFYAPDGAARSAAEVLSRLRIEGGGEATPAKAPARAMLDWARPFDDFLEAGADLWSIAMRAYGREDEDQSLRPKGQ